MTHDAAEKPSCTTDAELQALIDSLPSGPVSERLKGLAQSQLGLSGRLTDLGKKTAEAIAIHESAHGDRMAAKLDHALGLLKDPDVIFHALKDGRLGRPSVAQIRQIYGAELDAAPLEDTASVTI